MATSSHPTLYERLGGVYSIATVVDDLGLGTGAGLKRVPLGNPGVSYRDLLYVRR